MKRYDSYKPSGIDWIGEIPSHWKTMPTKYVLDNLDYLRQPISAEDRDRTNPQYDYYGASGVIDKIDYYNVEDTVLLIGEDGANLVMRNLPLIYKASGKFWVNNHAHILKPKKFQDYSFLAYLLEAGDYTLFITGSAQPKLSQENLNNYPICIPPLSEQEAIARWLDNKCGEIDAAIAKVNREIELIEELKQSEISRVVTRGLNPDVPLHPSGIDWIGEIPEHWKVCRLGLVFQAKAGGDAKPEIYNDTKTEIYKYPVYTNSLIENQIYAYTSDAPFKGKSITVTGRGEIGHAFYRDHDFDAIIRLLVLTPYKKLCGKYFTYLIDGVMEFFCDNAAVGQLSALQISKEYIIVPPLSEQQAIADYLDRKCAEIDGLKANLTKKRETLKELRQSIISEVVTGKRKVI